MSVQQAIGNALIIVSAIESALFVALYATVAAWWRSETGRHVMAFMASIAAVLTLSTVRILAGDAWWFAWLRLVVFALIPTVLGWRLVILWQAQIRPRLRQWRSARAPGSSGRH